MKLWCSWSEPKRCVNVLSIVSNELLSLHGEVGLAWLDMKKRRRNKERMCTGICEGPARDSLWVCRIKGEMLLIYPLRHCGPRSRSARVVETGQWRPQHRPTPVDKWRVVLPFNHYQLAQGASGGQEVDIARP